MLSKNVETFMGCDWEPAEADTILFGAPFDSTTSYRARLAVIPMQDYLGLDNRCRMNTPSTVGKNWKWRLLPGQMSDEVLELIGAVTKRYGRWNWR